MHVGDGGDLSLNKRADEGIFFKLALFVCCFKEDMSQHRGGSQVHSVS